MAGLTPNQTVTTRSPTASYPAVPADPEQDRVEPDTDPECCEDLSPGQFCQPSCVRNIQNDETALAVDMGYYLDFQVDPETGRPGGCDCFTRASRYPDWRTSRIVDCPKQSYAPEGEPLHQIVEEYADNQDLWIKVSPSQFRYDTINFYSGLSGSFGQNVSEWKRSFQSY